MDNVLVSFSKIMRYTIFFFFLNNLISFTCVFKLRLLDGASDPLVFFFRDWYFRTCDGKSHKMSRLFYFVVRESNLIPSLLMPCPRTSVSCSCRANAIICFLRFISHLDSKRIVYRPISTDTRNLTKIGVWTLPFTLTIGICHTS